MGQWDVSLASNGPWVVSRGMATYEKQVRYARNEQEGALSRGIPRSTVHFLDPQEERCKEMALAQAESVRIAV